MKINEIKNDKTIDELKSKIRNIEENEDYKLFKEKLDKIFSKIKEFDLEMKEIKNRIEESEKHNNEIIKNTINNIKDKENDLSLSLKKIDEFLSKIIILEENIKINKERTQEFEININNKLLEFNNKVNMNLKKLNGSEQDIISKNSINFLNEKNIKLENIIQEKINEKMKLLDEKIQILNKKLIDLEIKNINKIYNFSKNKSEESSFLKDNSYLDKTNELEETLSKNNTEINKDTKDNNKKKNLL